MIKENPIPIIKNKHRIKNPIESMIKENNIESMIKENPIYSLHTKKQQHIKRKY